MIRKRGQKYQARCRINGRLYEKTYNNLNSAEQWVFKTKLKYNDKTLKITSQNGGVQMFNLHKDFIIIV